jgi:PAS domain S-box-containing protein
MKTENAFGSNLNSIGNTRQSIHLFRMVFAGILAILCIVAAYLSFFEKFPDTFAPVDFSFYPVGTIIPDEYISPFGREPESFATIHEDETANDRKYLRLTVNSGYDVEEWGVVFGVNRTIPSNASIRFTWRGSGRTRDFMIDISDGKGEYFEVVTEVPGEDWKQDEIRLNTLNSKDWQEPHVDSDGIFLFEDFRQVNISFHQGTEMVLDIRSIDIIWRSNQWAYVSIIAIILAFGLLLWWRTSSRRFMATGEWNFRSGGFIARFAYIPLALSIIAAVWWHDSTLLSPASVIVYCLFFLMLIIDEFFRKDTVSVFICPWRYMIILTGGLYFGFDPNWIQLFLLFCVAILPAVQNRSRAHILIMPAAAVMILVLFTDFEAASMLPRAIAIVGTMTIVGVLIRQLIHNAEAQRENRHAIALYEQALAHTSEAILLVSPEGDIRRINRGFESLTGYNETELIGNSFADHVHPDDRSLIPFGEPANEGDAAKLLDLRIVNRQNESRSLLVRTVPLIRGEELAGYQIIGTDVTERRKLEHKLNQAHRLDSLGALAGGVAHDFNNLLGAILGYASFLKMRVDEGHDFYKPLDLIEQGATRAADLTGKLLAFARGGGYEVKPLNLNSIVTETIAILEGSFDKSIHIKVTLDESLPNLEGDSGQLQQVLLNLCVNARDAMPDGGTLLIETSQETTDAAFVKEHIGAQIGRYIVLSVSDTGNGMDKKTQQRIFDPFFTTKAKQKGAGLGLSMTHGIIKTHGGIIQVYSEPAAGSKFRVYLPASDKMVVAESPVSREVEGGMERILVVDDEEYMRDLVTDILESAGYTVLTAENGEEALSIYREHGSTIDIVILDMIMPKLGGRETFLKLQEMDPGVKVLVSTGYSVEGTAREVMDHGAAGFIQKPYRSQDLQQKIRSTLGAASNA